ncbi:hypothetical protein ACFLV3_02310 [Chloroflexota bacterium]
MSIEWFRDLVISIFGLVAVGVLILIAVLLFLLYRRVKSILDALKSTSATVRAVSSYVGEEVAKPLIEVVALIQGIRMGMDRVSKFFKK